MLPRASRAVALALARRASAAASEPIAASGAAAAGSGGVAARASPSPPLLLVNPWQARALSSTASCSPSVVAAAAASSPTLLRAWQQPRRSFAASASGSNDKEGDGGKEDADKAAAEDSSDADQQPAATDPLAKELEEAKQRAAALTEKLQYALAEAENVRQRARRELETKAQFAVADLAKQLLDVADNLWRAEEAVPKPVRDALFGEGAGDGSGAEAALDAAKATALLKSLLEGLRATDRGLHEVLRKQGIERYDPTGEAFDPNLHAAMFQVPDATREAGTVAAVHRRGYMIRDRVLRAAEVGVAREP
jgi:molecular chaperone GrpE